MKKKKIEFLSTESTQACLDGMLKPLLREILVPLLVVVFTRTKLRADISLGRHLRERLPQKRLRASVGVGRIKEIDALIDRKRDGAHRGPFVDWSPTANFSPQGVLAPPEARCRSQLLKKFVWVP